MQFDSITNLIITLVILVLMFYFYMAAHLANLKQEISRKSYLAEVDLIRKNDLIPIFLDKMVEGISVEERKTLIEWRSKSSQSTYESSEQKSLEEVINKSVGKMMENISGQEKLSKSIDFAQFKKNWNEQMDKLLISGKTYQKSAENFNKLVKNPLFLPIKKVLKLSPLK